MNRVQSRGAAALPASGVDEDASQGVGPVPGSDPEEIEPAKLSTGTGRARAGTTRVETGHLTFHGGRVLRSPDVTPVYVGASWTTREGEKSRARNDAALAALVKDRGQTGIWAQYGSGPGTTSASIVLPGRSRSVYEQSDVEALVRDQIHRGAFDASDPERIFTIVLPPGAELRDGGASSKHGLGGYHGSVTGPDGHQTYYAVVAYSERTGARVNGIDFTGKPLDNVSITESHEISEAVTDPDVGVAIRTGDAGALGWYDDTTPVLRKDGSPVLDAAGRPMRGKGEIGDIPVLNAELEGDVRLKVVWGRSAGFAFQTEWSNRDGKAEL